MAQTVSVDKSLIYPLQNEISAPLDTNIILAFDAIVSDITVDTNDIKIFGNMTGLIEGLFSYSGNMIEFDPATAFFPGERVMVTVNGDSLSSPFVWEFTVENKLCPNIHFGAQQLIDGTINSAYGILPTDLDNDGDLDIVASSWDPDQIVWYENRNDSTGKFETAVIINSTVHSTQMLVADMDNDGDKDIVYISSTELGWIRNDGLTAWTASTIPLDPLLTTLDPSDYPTEVFNLRSIRIGDLNGNGKLDIFLLSGRGGVLLWVENLGGGIFDDGHFIAKSTGLQIGGDLAIVDLNADGHLDVAWGYRNGGSPHIMWAENISASSWLLHDLGEGKVEAMQGADIDQDGDMDLAIQFQDPKNVGWMEMESGVSDSVHILEYTGFAPLLEVADLNGDNQWDFLSGWSWYGKLNWFQKPIIQLSWIITRLPPAWSAAN